MLRNLPSGTRELVHSSAETPAIEVAILLLPGFSLGEFSQVADALSLANRDGIRSRFEWAVYGLEEGHVESSAGIELACRAATELRQSRMSLLIIGPRPRDPKDWMKLASVVRFCRRHNGFIAGIGDAVEVLAQLGLLGGRKACSHWQGRRVLREHHPDVDFGDHIFAIDGSIGTCAGAGATADFALEWIARFTGQTVADQLARKLTCTPRRKAERSQRRTQLARFAGAHAGFLSAIEVIQQDESRGLDITGVAAAAGVSPRQLQRLFKRYLKRTPSECIRAHRLQQAQELLTRTPMSIIEVALATGFESPTHFSRRYMQAFGLTPSKARRASWS